MDEHQEQTPIQLPPKEDVDDLIFCTSSDWYVSDR